MWTVIYVSQTRQTAKKLMDELYASGIISKLRRADVSAGEESCLEVLVPNTEMEAAQDLIIENDLF